MSPSPMPPPRSRARGDKIANKDDAAVTATARATIERNGNSPDSDILTPTSVIGARTAELAAGVLGVVVLLASEWVEVGSGLAEVSLRADTWGQRLLSLLLEVREEDGIGGERREGRGTLITLNLLLSAAS